jgi:hypothetical protein
MHQFFSYKFATVANFQERKLTDSDEPRVAATRWEIAATLGDAKSESAPRRKLRP